jgi:hypothetical protein
VTGSRNTTREGARCEISAPGQRAGTRVRGRLPLAEPVEGVRVLAELVLYPFPGWSRRRRLGAGSPVRWRRCFVLRLYIPGGRSPGLAPASGPGASTSRVTGLTGGCVLRTSGQAVGHPAWPARLSDRPKAKRLACSSAEPPRRGPCRMRAEAGYSAAAEQAANHLPLRDPRGYGIPHGTSPPAGRAIGSPAGRDDGKACKLAFPQFKWCARDTCVSGAPSGAPRKPSSVRPVVGRLVVTGGFRTERQ